VAPSYIDFTAFVHERYAIFVLPALLCALEPRGKPIRAFRYVLAFGAATWLGFVAWRFARFQREARPGAELIAMIEPGKRVLGLINPPTSTVFPGYPYLHFASWYPAEKGGIADFSFAIYYPNHFRYRPKQMPAFFGGVEWGPSNFDWEYHGGANYDYLLIRRRDPAWKPYAQADVPTEIVAERGEWVLVRQLIHHEKLQDSAPL
jgi:hypothetical protein